MNRGPPRDGCLARSAGLRRRGRSVGSRSVSHAQPHRSSFRTDEAFARRPPARPSLRTDADRVDARVSRVGHPAGMRRPSTGRPEDRGRLIPGRRVAGRRGPRPVRQGKERQQMAIGPVQLIVLGFQHPNFHGEVIAELERLRRSDTVRVIDALAVYKDARGEVEVEHLSNLSTEEAVELGSKIGALIGLGIEGEAGMEAGALLGAEAAAEQGGVHVFSDAEAWDVLADIPDDSAAALLLIEHHWAVPLRDAIARAGGFRLSDGFISPLDLIAIGLVTAEEAKELHDTETAAASR